MLQCCHIVLFQEILDKNRLVYWSIFVGEKPTAGFPFFGSFPFPRRRRMIMYISYAQQELLEIIPANSYKLYQHIYVCIYILKLFPVDTPAIFCFQTPLICLSSHELVPESSFRYVKFGIRMNTPFRWPLTEAETCRNNN
jgi:hypothetical protein